MRALNAEQQWEPPTGKGSRLRVEHVTEHKRNAQRNTLYLWMAHARADEHNMARSNRVGRLRSTDGLAALRTAEAAEGGEGGGGEM